MKVAKWYNNSDIRIEEEPVSSPAADEILVRVLSCGICGSDIVEWYRLPRAPLVQGHEIGAEVVEVGEAAARFKPGDRVCIAPKAPCMACRYCLQGQHPVCTEVKDRLPGGFAEYITVPEALVRHGTYLLPDTLSYDQSTFIEPLACAVRAQKIAGLAKSHRILILGCGMSGLLHTKLATERGCHVVAADINPYRLGIAEKAGAHTIDATGNVAEQLEKEGRKADIVMICTSAVAAVEQAWQSVDRGGAVVFFAVPGPDIPIQIPINQFWTKEVRILTSYYCGPDDLKEAIVLLETGRITVNELITHILPLEKITEGFRLVSEGRASLKVIIHPNE